MGMVLPVPRTTFVASCATARTEVIPLFRREAMLREGLAALIALPIHFSSCLLKRCSFLHHFKRRCTPFSAYWVSKPFRAISSWPCCYPLSLCTRSFSAPSYNDCCGHVSLKRRRHKNRRVRPRCGLNRCGSSGGSSCVKDRRVISFRCSSSDSSKRGSSFVQRDCQAYNLNYSCVDSKTSCCRLEHRGHKNQANQRLTRFSRSTHSKVTVASNRFTDSSSFYWSKSISVQRYSHTSRHTRGSCGQHWRSSNFHKSRTSSCRHVLSGGGVGHHNFGNFGGKCKGYNVNRYYRSAKRNQWHFFFTLRYQHSSNKRMHNRQRHPSSSLTLALRCRLPFHVSPVARAKLVSQVHTFGVRPRAVVVLAALVPTTTASSTKVLRMATIIAILAVMASFRCPMGTCIQVTRQV